MPELCDERELINAQLKAKLLARLPESGLKPTAIEGLALSRHGRNEHLCNFYKPFVGLTVQGCKQSIIGKHEYTYGAYHCVVAGMDMPSQSHIVTASDDEPFLAIALDLNRDLVAQLASEMSAESLTRQHSGGVAVMEADPRVMRAFLRLLELLDEPDEIPIMAPVLIREIHHRLLLGPQGAWLRYICFPGMSGNQIAQAVSWLRENFRVPLQVDDLAAHVGMSVSSFFRNFKRATSLSPLQFQKALRLYEAQRLMLSNEYDVADAAYSVGYESSTQFIREYKRMFGEPPHRDITRRRVELASELA